jgi:glucokinase
MIMSDKRQLISAEGAQAPLFVGVDLGGTNIKAGVVDDLGRPVSWVSVPTKVEKGPEDVTRRMGQAVKSAIAEADLQPSDIARVGLGSPGPMDIPSGILHRPANLKSEKEDAWDRFPIRDLLAKECGLPVAFANDADSAAYGEYWVGSGREYDSMVLFTLGTGIGCGIIVAEKLISGAHSHGAECGHIIIDQNDDARMCGCGKTGHLEAYASALAVIARTKELLEMGRETSLSMRIAEGVKLTPKLIAQEAEAGDQLSLEIVMDTAGYMGVGVVNLMHTVDPQCVLLGGAMTFGGSGSELGRRFLARLKEEVQARAFPELAKHTIIDFATLGGDAGFIGSAGIARLQHSAAK